MELLQDSIKELNTILMMRDGKVRDIMHNLTRCRYYQQKKEVSAYKNKMKPILLSDYSPTNTIIDFNNNLSCQVQINVANINICLLRS